MENRWDLTAISERVDCAFTEDVFITILVLAWWIVESGRVELERGKHML